ncbi:hypothetical protein PENSPDRAFT_325040 [Peniophora sp. CONT]|nr:hypothetical protein PENSPDRAFT_325040 [Peniophora sp. CONT]
MPHVALWHWSLDNADGRQSSSTTYHALGMYETAATYMKDSGFVALVDELILTPGALGVDNFFAALNATLAHGVCTQEDGTGKPTLNSLCEVLRLLDVPPMHPHLRQHGVHESLVRFAADMVRINPSNASPQYLEGVWTLAVSITRRLLEDGSRLGSAQIVEGVRGEDVITLISSMLDWIAMANVRDGARREDAVCQLIKLLEPTILTLQAKRKRNTLAKVFTAGLKKQARADWWPSLRAMQAVRYWIPPTETYQIIVHDAAVREWTHLGEALGLSMELEQKRYEQEAARRCAWFACPSHRTTPNESITLLSCKGCGDARYCGRACQISDWNLKEGGHKRKCRRLKGST